MPRPRRQDIEIVTEPKQDTETLEQIGESLSGNNPEDFEQLVEDGRMLVHLGEKNVWAKADLAMEATEKYGMLKELCERLGQNYGYWRVLSSVAKQYSREDRDRFLDLTFAHFQVVAGRDDRLELLKEANDQGLSVRRLIRRTQPEPEALTLDKIKTDENVSSEMPHQLNQLFPPGDNLNVNVNDTPQSRGRQIEEACELLNYISVLDPEVALGIGKSLRQCKPELQEWIGEVLDRNPDGMGVLDLFNVLFSDQGKIEFLGLVEEIPFVVKRI